MKFIYHIKPEVIVGDCLMPLNELKIAQPDLYKEAVKKYEGRTYLLEKRLPILNCLWNDVLHFSPIHADQYRNYLFPLLKNPYRKLQWLKIPVENLIGVPTITFSAPPVAFGQEVNMNESICHPFSVDTYEEQNQIPQWTKDYYHDEIKNDRRPLLFNGVMHVLAKGRVPLNGVEVI